MNESTSDSFKDKAAVMKNKLNQILKNERKNTKV